MSAAPEQPLAPRSELARVVALIPAWQPEERLLGLVDRLIALGFADVLVVDDGSAAASRPVFAEVAKRAQVTLLRHAVNLGKGRALKTGFNWVLTERPDCAGVVTADADGQHAPEDIANVARALLADPARVALGARTFSPDVPLRSRFGNELTRVIFGFVTGKKLRDTQTGLRAIPKALLPELLALDGERYEYEMTVLAHLCRAGRAPQEVPIQTIYLEGNRSSHFDPIRDSMRIYFVLARFYVSSIVAAGVDNLAFFIAHRLTGNLFAAQAASRVVSSWVNFAVNKQFVFQSKASAGRAVVRYYLLAAGIFAASYVCIRVLSVQLGWNVYASKVLVDTVLSLASFSVQRTFVFREKPDQETL